MLSLIKSPILLAMLVILFQACSKGPLDGEMASNMSKLDDVYGACKNPHKILNAKERMLCEDRQRAAGPGGEVKSPLNLSKLTAGLRGDGSTTIIQGLTINQYLWQASLSLLDAYPIKIVDSQGGFVSTEWITNSSSPNQRCNIKVTVTSKDLVSNGVKVKLICQKKTDDTWYNETTSYTSEEKDLTLKILETAIQIKVENELS